MSIKRRKSTKIEIDLKGPNGNAFVLLGYTKQYAKQLNLNYTEISKEMTSGNYENLINTFDKYFGDYIDLIK